MVHQETAVIKIGQKYNNKHDTKDSKGATPGHGAPIDYQARKQMSSMFSFPPIKFNIYVKILDSASRIVFEGIDIVALRRFSFAARAVLPRANTTYKHSEVFVRYSLPSRGDVVHRSPSSGAFRAVFGWMTTNKRLQGWPNPIHDDVVNENIFMQIEILSICSTLQVKPYPKLLSRHVARTIRQAPINVDLLSHTYELLPHDHEVLVAAVQSLTHFYRFRKIDAPQNELLEEYMVADDKLHGMFELEMVRQKKMHNRFRKRCWNRFNGGYHPGVTEGASMGHVGQSDATNLGVTECIN